MNLSTPLAGIQHDSIDPAAERVGRFGADGGIVSDLNHLAVVTLVRLAAGAAKLSIYVAPPAVDQVRINSVVVGAFVLNRSDAASRSNVKNMMKKPLTNVRTGSTLGRRKNQALLQRERPSTRGGHARTERAETRCLWYSDS